MRDGSAYFTYNGYPTKMWHFMTDNVLKFVELWVKLY